MPNARLSKELTALMLNLKNESVPVSELYARSRPNSMIRLFQKYAREDSIKTHAYFASMWRSLIDSALDNLIRRIHHFEAEAFRIQQTVDILMNAIRGVPLGESLTGHMTECMSRCIDYTNQINAYKMNISVLRKVYLQLSETFTLSSIEGAGDTGEMEAVCYLTLDSKPLVQQDARFKPEVPASTEALDDRKVFYSESSRMDWAAPGLLAKTKPAKTIWTTEYNPHGVYAFCPASWEHVKYDYGITRGKVAALLITMDSLLNIGATPSRNYANAIETELRKIVPLTPTINATFCVVPAEGIVDKDGDKVMDPVLYTPFESGSTAYKMRCCSNYLSQETIDGIIASGRTARCPMCRCSLRREEGEHDDDDIDYGSDSDDTLSLRSVE